ncbi:MAG TPA: hypothetical protein DDZ51_17685 [Planctomycetaceae bacterium]|nr:hypothetical protein [Planctomycetaceae bacterium]
MAQRVALEKRMARQLPSFVAMHFLADSAKEELWRLSVRVRSGTDVDLQGLVLQLRQTVDETLQRTPYFPGVTATICGGIPLITKSQDQLLKDMTQSFISAFGLISVAMMLTLRSVIGGLLTMVSNILPTVVLFGLLGLIGIKIEIGSMMTATAAMGIAVDDTLHFVSWFRRGCRDRLSKSAALVYAHKHCSRAMIQTSIICGFGMLFFSLSGFAPIARFSWLMFTMLFVALLGDLIVLPAIISTRLGDFLVPKQPGIPSDTTTLGQESHFSQRSD